MELDESLNRIIKHTTEKDIIHYIDNNNLCSSDNGGCWLTPEKYFHLLDYYPNFFTIIWLVQHNVMATSKGCNIGSNLWQPYRSKVLSKFGVKK
ncbi:MAG: hypothetical protein WC389_11800 [Lutibacter sp.]|jgi:hypothetical protein